MNIEYIKLKSFNYFIKFKNNKLLVRIGINIAIWLVIIGILIYLVDVKLPLDTPGLSPQERADLTKVTAYRLDKQNLIHANLKIMFQKGELLSFTSTPNRKVALFSFSQWLHLVAIQNKVRYHPGKIKYLHEEISSYRDTKLFKITTEQANEISKNKKEAFDKSWQRFKRFKFRDFWSSFDTGLQMLALQLETNIDKNLKIFSGSPTKRTARVLQWRNQILAVAKKYQLDPALIAAQIEQESGGNPNAISPAGAVGLMQLMPSTARGLGVNPFDPMQNIDGGSKYIKMQIDRFGSVENALIAYNAGPSRVGKPLYVETAGYIRNVPAMMKKYRPYFKNVELVNLKPLFQGK